MLISATKRNGTVREESWDVVTHGKRTYVVNAELAEPLLVMLANARAQIDSWKYDVTSRNCEHFVKWVAGFEVTSTQVVAAGAGGLTGAALVATLCEDPKWFKFLGGILLVGGLAVLVTKAIEKKQPNKRVHADHLSI